LQRLGLRRSQLSAYLALVGSGSTVMDDVLTTAIGTVIGAALGVAAVYAFWRMRSMIQLWQAAEQPLHSSRTVIWRAPEEVGRLDLAAGPGGSQGAPVPPFTFLEEHLTGSRPCVSVGDARGRKWRVKWGNEVQVETLATRLAWAAGYFVETTYYVAEGRIEHAAKLVRAGRNIDTSGHFTDARFELDEAGVIKHFDEHSWAWNDNPFVGTHELNGLKIVMMWLSNWDAKDVRDVARGSNTAIFEYPGRDGHREARYLIIDWGGALGRWGNVVQRGRWDCEGFAAESAAFVKGVDGGFVRFGYTGQRTSDIAAGIRVDDVRWLMNTLGGLTDAQMAAAVAASGGTPDEVTGFTRALRARLNALAAVRTTDENLSSNPA
jgi:hypothetical protein